MGEFFVFSILFIISFLSFNLYGKVKRNRKLHRDVQELLDEVQETHLTLDKLVGQYNEVVRAHNRLVREKSSGYWAEEVKTNPFTPSEIKRLKHYLHPDKHGGKTDDLFIRVSQLGEK